MITTTVKDKKDILRKKKMCEYERKRDREHGRDTVEVKKESQCMLSEHKNANTLAE